MVATTAAVYGAYAAAAAAAASAAASGYQGYQEGKSQSATQKENAGILRKNATRTRQETAINQDRQRASNRQALSTISAITGEMGMEESPTSIGAMAQEAADLEQKALDVKYTGATEAENYIMQSSLHTRYAKQARQQGRNAFYMGLVGGASSGISTYASLK